MAEDTALSHLRSLLDVQVQLTREQEERAKRACRKLVEMLESLDPAAVEQLNRGGRPVENLGVDALVDLFLRFLRDRMAKLTAEKQELEKYLSRVQSPPDDILQLKTDLESLQEEKQQITHALENAKEQIKRLQDQLAVARQTASMVHPDESQAVAAPPDEEPPQWFLLWKTGRGSEREVLYLEVIGETGWSCVPHIQQEVLSRLNRAIETVPNSIKDIHRRLDEVGLVELDRPWQQEGSSAGGRLPDMIRLSSRGREAYRLLTGQEAKPCEFDVLIKAHKSPEHTLLNIQARWFLLKEQFEILAEAPAFKLTDGGSFQPDLAVVDTYGEVLYIEVERDASKNSVRQAKWRNFHAATGGKLYIICDNRTCMRAIRSEVTSLLLQHTPGDLYITNLADLQAGKRGQGNSIWLEMRLRSTGPNPVQKHGLNPGSVLRRTDQ